MTEPRFEVVTAAGVLIQPFADRPRAVRWARENARTFPGLTVVEVVTPPPVRRVVWKEPVVRVEVDNVTQLRRVG